jgi:aspartate/methionine/tyrosine aminotransferase
MTPERAIWHSPHVNRTSAKLAAISPSATLAVDSKAKALQAAGEAVIGFGAGEPDFPTPDWIVEAAVEACRDPRNHKYTPASGLPELRAAIVAKTLRDSKVSYDPSQVLVTNGGKHAVFTTFAALLDPGDEVLLPAPYWTTYPEAIALADGVPVVVDCPDTAGFKVTIDQLDAARTDRTKALLFVSPSNPTGAVYTPDEVRAIGEWALANGVWVVTDEIYEHLVFGDNVFSSMPAQVPALVDQTVIINGVAKTYAMTGWRVGWMIGPADVIKAATNLQSHATSNVSNIMQIAALGAVSGPLTAVDEMKVAFDRRRKAIVAGLNAIDGVECPTPKGAFYVYADVRALLGTEFPTAGGSATPSTSAELAALILDEVEVAVVPGEAFGPSGFLRLSYALGDDDLATGVARLQEFLGKAQ